MWCPRFTYLLRASTPLKHGRSLRPWKKRGGTKIMHIFVKIGGKEKLRGKVRINYLSTYLHCLPLIFSKLFSLATLTPLHFIFITKSGNAKHKLCGMDGSEKSVSLLKVGRKSVDFPSCTFDDLMSPNWSHKKSKFKHRVVHFLLYWYTPIMSRTR